MRICLINPTFADLYGVRMSACVRACVEAGRQCVRACVRDRETARLHACVRARQGDSVSACVRACESMHGWSPPWIFPICEVLPIYVCLWNLYCTPSLKQTS